MYPHAGYGGRFRVWLRSMDTEPYNSFGNDSVMRVSPCAWVMDCVFVQEQACGQVVNQLDYRLV